MSDIEVVQFGPWLGSMRSVTGDQVPPEFIASIKDFTAANNYNDTDSSNNMLFLPRTGEWKLRGGSSVKFDTYGSLVGLLPDKWEDDPNGSSLGSRIRHFEEFLSDSISDGIPTIIALCTRETVPSTLLDDGRFSNVYIRDQVNSLNYTIGNEYTQTYAAVGTTQTYRIIPLWYDSGDGGITRGTTEYNRRFFFNGSRRFLGVGKEIFFPSVLGTPSRWRKKFAHSAVAGTVVTSQADGDVTASGTQWAIGGSAPAATNWQSIQTSDDGVTFVRAQSGSSRTFYHESDGTYADNKTYTIHYRARYQSGPVHASFYHQFAIICSGQERYTSAQIFVNTGPSGYSAYTTSFADYTVTVTCNGTNSNSGLGANRIELGAAGGDSATNFDITYLYVTEGDADSSDNANYLMPTGPFPPTHAGSVAAGNLATGSNTVNLVPDADGSTDGDWTASTGSDLYAMVDDTVGSPNDSDYITATSGTNHAIVRLSDPGFDVDSSLYRVTLWNRVLKTSALASPGLSVDIWEGDTGTEITTGNVSFATSFTTSFANYSYQLTDAEVDSVTDWTNLFLRYDMTGTGTFRISASWVEITPIGESAGGWKGKDRFLRACAYRYEDGSVWAGSVPRFPNTTLTSGFNLTTVDSNNPNAAYDKVVWSNIPVPPKGVTHVQLWRTPKIDSTVDDNLQLNPFDMRFVDEVPAGITTYDDYKGDDESLVLDAEKYFIRHDHIMQPRTRYMAGGDMRVVAGYGGTNPCAITIAPIGRVADYDLNTADNVAATYGSGTSDASYMRLDLNNAGTIMTLTLAMDNGSSLTTDTYTGGSGGTYSTIQALVDAINATSVSGTPDTGQWRAQLCPGVDGSASPTSLCPHLRVIDSCTVSGQTITVASSALGKVAVGSMILRSGVATSAQVTSIDSVSSTSSQVTFTGTVTSGSGLSMSFYFDVGDSPASSTVYGYQRVIANSLPGFIYFTKTYLDTQTFDKAATWMTVASPGSVKAAPNCWSGKLSNRFTPPLEAGFVQGMGAVDHGFVVLYGNKVGAIRPRGPDSFTDQEYGLVIIDESRGCIAWNTVCPGNRFVPFLSREGMFAADLRDVKLLTSETYVDQPSAIGDFYYEAPKCIAATAMDVDVYLTASDTSLSIGAYAWARIVNGVLFVGYRSGNTGGITHCDRMVRLDFTTGDEATGLPALYRKPGLVWGWSTPLLGSGSGTSAIYRYALITGARRSDGNHIYGWNEENAGTTGDGRIDEIETGTTDPSSTAITGRVETPWVRPQGSDLISGQEVILEHSSPVSSTGSLVYHRTLSDDSYTLTPGTSSLPMYSEMKFLSQPARTAANAAYIDYRQLTGSARAVRRIVLRFRRIRRFKT